MVDSETVGVRIAEARQAAGMTQAELARAIGVTPVTVSNWERGRHPVTEARLREIAEALRTTPAEIRYGGISNAQTTAGQRVIDYSRTDASDSSDLTAQMSRAAVSMARWALAAHPEATTPETRFAVVNQALLDQQFLLRLGYSVIQRLSGIGLDLSDAKVEKLVADIIDDAAAALDTVRRRVGDDVRRHVSDEQLRAIPEDTFDGFRELIMHGVHPPGGGEPEPAPASSSNASPDADAASPRDPKADSVIESAAQVDEAVRRHREKPAQRPPRRKSGSGG